MMNEYDFRNKFALLDTNILSKFAKEKQAQKFRSVFDFLHENDVEIFLTDATYFEFIGFTPNKKDRDILKAVVSQFPIVNMKVEDVEMASVLSSCYKRLDPILNPKQISYVDCLHAAQLIKYKGRAFIVTADIHDYPISVFDISKVMVIEDGQRANIIGLITFNENKWSKVRASFEG
ncbi:PIN domain-containing protein [bacterium]|nr:PIN domain-containing protein [bacterium]